MLANKWKITTWIVYCMHAKLLLKAKLENKKLYGIYAFSQSFNFNLGITIHILPIRKNLFFCFLSCWRSFGLCNRKNNSYKSNIFYTHPSDVKIRTNNRGKTFLMQLWKITRVLFSTLCQGCFTLHYVRDLNITERRKIWGILSIFALRCLFTIGGLVCQFTY